ncbi:ligand-gated channel protein [Providencia hangzhouensis]|uniref:Ligand-gated channel protein n=1 Tax=Providencia rettgeri TaxID=587 RepID=A0AAJ4NLZ1_PRORE|nr:MULTISPECIES: ligand-gated channel protein [Providencia]MBJ9970686.1 ligand-gated channel protein [Providencia rettgeri]MCF8963409.1 Colicin I receptor [Providencia rettgeri]QWQ18459.1 ligand-gated channel protein [Providencia rettgeri]QWQ22293.1 ligand-gated channel protein [Providencia rettgeri]QWQ26128.1 ligand-gated channel protein [Providencia rettgeri]
MVVFNKRKVAISIIAAIAAAPAFADDSNDKIYVTTASGYQQKIEDAPASISVVTREQLETKAYRDVTDALKDLPGVQVTGGGSKADISIRGMDAKYTMIMVDGKRIDSRSTRPNSDGSGIEQGWLPPLPAIERIEVVRGPMSSLYGSDAMGGVINIITRKVGKKWNGSLRADTTINSHRDSGNEGQGSFYASGPLVDGLLGMKVNGIYSKRWEDKFVGGYNEQKIGAIGTTLTLTPDEFNTFDFDFKHDEQERNTTAGKSGNLICTKKVNEIPTKYRCEDSNVTYRKNNYALTHNGIYDWGAMETFVQRDETKNPSRKMEYNDTLVKNQTVFNLGDHTLSIGGQYRYEDLRDKGNKLASAGGIDSLTRYSWALFAEDEWMMTNDLALTGGIRMDKDENFGSHWTPRLYGVWHATDEWIIKGGVSTGYRSPELRQVAPNWGQGTGGGGDPAVIIGNPALKPEKSVTEEIGFIWNNQDNLNVGVTFFNTEFKDKIMEIRKCTDSTGDKPGTVASGECMYDGEAYKFISSRENVDKANLRGAELTFNWDITSDLIFAANYTYSDSEQKSGTFKGKPLSRTPKHMANGSLTWQATEDLQLWNRVNFNGKSSSYLSRTSMSEERPSYTFVDIGASYNIDKNINLVAGMYNIFDKRLTVESNDKVLDGRRYNFGINYNF